MELRHALSGALVLTTLFAPTLFATPATRESFDAGWKFARFGTLADGTFRAEPGARASLITASSEEPGNPATQAVDGNRETRWCAAGDATNQWLVLDLGRREMLGGLRIVWEKATANPFSVELSDDKDLWREVVSRRAAGAVEENLKFSASGRYLRLNVDGSPGAWASVRSLEPLDAQGNSVELRAPTVSMVAQPGYDDSGWRVVDLPHDWAIEGPFRAEIENETGKLPWEGIGWYRKSFDLPAGTGRRYYLDVDGAMAQPKIYVNGILAGEWKYGYNSFRVDLTPHLKPAAPNTVAIRLENLPASTRWYPGAGLYRHVWWVETPTAHLAQWGVHVTTPEITDERAVVAVATTVENHGDAPARLAVRQEILDPAGKVVATVEAPLSVTNGQAAVSRMQLAVARPQRWDLGHPQLYTLRTTVLDGGQSLDVRQTAFGIREIAWDAQKGFLLNGRKVVLRGVCNHHDLGPLGTAVHTRAIERQIELLQEMGCNAIRTSHNPPAPELLELCDRMGMLVIDELFDVWKMQKYGKVNGYNIFWDDWHEKDVRNFMLRDRNHPSVIAWSTGNEIAELGTPSMHWVPARLRDLIRQYDTTRPVTAGANHPPAATNGFQKTVDVFGLNYYLGDYDRVAGALTNMPLFASETASTVSTRGEYFFPADWDKSKGFFQFQVSSYDLYAPGWACRPDLQFEALDKHPRFAGEFVWTGFDYLGEPTPYNQDETVALNFANAQEREKAMEELRRLGNRAPSRSSYFGILDLCGFKKDRFYLYQARWRPELPVAHLLPHWNWPERRGEVTPVHAYINGDAAELFLNGRSLGKRTLGEPHRYRLTWDDVKYEPGKLELVVTKAGKPWATAVRETTGEPAQLELTADRADIAGDGRDLSYFTVRVLDRQGREVPRTRLPVQVRVRGPVDIVGIGNGDPTDQTPMKPADPAQAQITAFNGLAQIIVRSHRGQSGAAFVEISAEGIDAAHTQVLVKP